MNPLLRKLTAAYPQLDFCLGERFYWSPKTKQIFYQDKSEEAYHWKLLHEVGHALLGHSTYNSDIELLQLEVAAWEKAKQLTPEFATAINPDYIQDCLDTYRDWLHKRSTCPTCGTRSLQENSERYHCFNCQASWQVSPSRFCRTYRQIKRHNKKSPASRQAIFS
jgi:ribosomal protein S27AE